MSERWKISRHARDRMTEMGLTRRDVLAAVKHPDLTRPGHRDLRDRQIVVGDDLVVVLAQRDRAIVTVLWRGCSGDDPRHVRPADRTGRGAPHGWGRGHSDRLAVPL